jgi:hypothetical protein
MDEQSKNIIRKKLQKLGDSRLSKDNLKEIRDEISEATGHNKFASFKNVRKWVSMVKKELKKEQAGSTKKEKASRGPAAEKSAPPVPGAVISDRVFMQTIGFEIAGIRRSMDRISNQLDELEKKLALKKEE